MGASDDDLQELITLAPTMPAAHLGEATFSALHEALYLRLVAAHDDWETVLGLALQAALSAASSSRSKASSAESSHPEVPREPTEEALEPLLAFAHGGRLLRVESLSIACARETPAAPAPLVGYPMDALGPPWALFDAGGASVVVAVSETGEGYGWDVRLVPDASEGEQARNLGDGAGVSAWSTLFDRRAMRRASRVLCVTREGQVKASDREAFSKQITSTGYTLTGVSEGDAVVAVLLEEASDEEIMLVSSTGYAIRFVASEVRSMGLKAGGVRGINLRGAARVVSALRCEEREQVALVTELGYGKRCLLEEFRPQSRGGLGLIAQKFSGEDALVAGVACDFNGDLALLTSHGRALRTPAGAWPLLGRATRGDRVVELAEGERVVSLVRLEPLDFDAL